MPALMGYETFIGVVPEAARTKSIVCVAWADAWMTCFIEDLERYFKGVRRGGREPHVRKTRYNELLPVASANIQAEGLPCLRRALSTAIDYVVQLQTELQF